MRDDIKKIIESIYLNGNIELFLAGCKSKLLFMNDLFNLLKNHCTDYYIYPDENEPIVEIQITINVFSMENIKIKYNSILKICKIINVYYIQHEFSIDNPDPNGMDSCFDGFRNEAYNKKQFEIDEKISAFLDSKGYTRLDNVDMEEIFPGISQFPDSCDKNKMTVDNALFMDLWNLCGIE